ncbi:MAG: Na/Pi symporter [Candidatus Thermoplasmatota archaeon]|nr:Na/Pi symporter [Candidatus Thermoplasmatota archaeon]
MNIRELWGRVLSNSIARSVLLFLSVYAFLLSIRLMGEGFELLGEGFSESLLGTISDPVSGFFIGILVTSVVQSSSCTTSILVAMCATGTLPVSMAIPAVMGANIGTTVTNTLVSFGHMTRKDEFRRALSVASVHDFFNILVAIILLPIEIFFHPLEKIAGRMTDSFVGVGGLKTTSPLKIIIDPVRNEVVDILSIFVSEDVLGIFVIVLAFLLLFLSLKVIVDGMRRFASEKADTLVNKYLFKSAPIAFLLGMGLTAFIQSSSISTSLIIPFAGAGILTVEKAFPYTLGTNVGTTLTAILASLASITVDPSGTIMTAGVTIAFVHLMFNLTGICIVYPIRKIPITLSKKLAEIAAEKKRIAIFYVVITFYIIPILYLVLKRWLYGI